MKFKFTFLPVILLFSLIQFAQAQNNESEQTKLRGFAMSQTFQREGQEYRYELETEDVKNTPSWNPANGGDPPLSWQSAVQIARANLKRFVKNADGWKIKTIKLDEVDTQKWIYDISFSCLSQECLEKFDTSFNLWVKMDGVVVEPIIKPIEKRNTR